MVMTQSIQKNPKHHVGIVQEPTKFNVFTLKIPRTKHWSLRILGEPYLPKG